MNVVGIISARSGSKSIPKKSIAPCAGRPLISYTCEAALACSHLKRVILSTDDLEIQRLGIALGVEAPFLRPAELASDHAPMAAVLQHALNWLGQNNQSVDALALLQPTSPLRTAKHIDDAIELFLRTSADTVVSIVAVPHQFNPISVLRMEHGKLAPFLPDQPPILRRQDKPQAYARNGPAVLVTNARIVRRGELYGPDTRGYLMAMEDSLDVDDPADLRQAELLLLKRREA